MPSSASDCVQRHRAKLRKAGLQPVQIWVPDIHRPGFAKECRRQSRLPRNDTLEQVVLDWFDSAADQDCWKRDGAIWRASRTKVVTASRDRR